MDPADIETALRHHRPEPPPVLRARVLAAATAALAPATATTPAAAHRHPWWGRCRTWAAAALVLFAIDALVMRSGTHPPDLRPAIANAAVDPATEPAADPAADPAAGPDAPTLADLVVDPDRRIRIAAIRARSQDHAP